MPPLNEELAGPPTSPVQATERLASLDVLRGFALLGILLSNIQDFAFAGGILHDIPLEVVQQTGAHHRLDVAVMVGQWLFVEGRMRALFGLLFGAGTLLLLERLERRAGPGRAADIFHRRNMWLFGFGLAHGLLIWAGDILFYYSVLALLALYPLRHVSGRRLAAAGFAISLLGGTLGISNAYDIRSAWPTARLQEQAAAAIAAHQHLSPAESKAVDDAVAHRHDELRDFDNNLASGRASYLSSEPGNVSGDLGFMALIFQSGWVFEVLGIMIAGMGMYKLGFLSAHWPSRTYLAIAVCGYIASSTIVIVGLNHARRSGFSDAVTTVWMFLPYGLGQIPGMLANASVLLLLIRRRWLMPVQQGLAAVGRTALSNYLLTSLLCQFLFKWGPWKLYGTLEYYQQIYVIAAVWTFNVVFSLLWLRVFAFGPFEWVWRSLTYWQRQPFRVLPTV